MSTPTRPEYPPNSRKQQYSLAKPEERPKLESVVSGEVRHRKPDFFTRSLRAMFVEDATSVRDYVVWDVIIPSLKNLVMDTLFTALDRSLYGDGRGRRTSYSRTSAPVPYSSTSRRPYTTRVERPTARVEYTPDRHEFGELEFPSADDAVAVIERLKQHVEDYGTASVGDLYSLIGQTATPTDELWGWTNLTDSNTNITRGRSGYHLDLPKPVSLDNAQRTSK